MGYRERHGSDEQLEQAMLLVLCLSRRYKNKDRAQSLLAAELLSRCWGCRSAGTEEDHGGIIINNSIITVLESGNNI